MPLIGAPLAMNAMRGSRAEQDVDAVGGGGLLHAGVAREGDRFDLEPCLAKMPWRMPTSSGTNENASGTALPTRSFSAAFATLPASPANSSAAAARPAIYASSTSSKILPVHRQPLLSGQTSCRAERAHGRPDLSRSRRLVVAGKSTLSSFVEHDPIMLPRGVQGNEFLHNVDANQLGIALERIAPAAAAAGAHDRLRVDRHRDVRRPPSA